MGFLSGWKLWRERIGVLAKIGIFWGIFGGFLEWLGPICKYFLKAEGPTIILPTVQGPRRNLQQG
jgi:hypothetical protein